MSVVPGDAEHRALEARVRRWAVPLVRQSVVSLRPAPSVSDESEVRDVPCQAPLCPFVDPALNVYLCCTHRRYRQGDLLHRGVFDGTFRRTLARGVHDRLAHFLVARGPVALLRELQGGLGVDGQRIARECRTNCELCEELLSGPASVPAVLALLDAYSPTEVVDRPVEFPIEGCDA